MEYDKSKFKIWTWKHPFMLHWILNPGLAFNEFILGQRIPKIVLIEKDASKTLQEKTKIPCIHCKTLHSGLKWSTKNNAFKNWLGLYCDNCGAIIPCLTNLTTYLLLGLTFPVWIWFKSKWKKDWLSKQPERYNNLDLKNVPDYFEGKGWIKQGLLWGLIMYVFMTLMFPIIDEEGITLKKALIGIPIWTLGGLGFGYAMKLINSKQQINTETKYEQ